MALSNNSISQYGFSPYPRPRQRGSTFRRRSRRMIRPGLSGAALALGLALGPASAWAGDWPNRAITIVVPFAAGSGSDIVGRILAPHISEQLGRPVIVENVGGASGVNGVARVARAAP